jgi:hypothetical protein
MGQNIHFNGFISLYLIPALLFLQIFWFLPDNNQSLFAVQGDTSDHLLDLAEQSYYNGEFEETIGLVKQCLADTTLNQENRKRANIILARTYLARSDQELAMEAIMNILQIDPTYRPTIEEEKPQFVNLVMEVRAAFERPATETTKSGLNKWLYVGASAVAATAIILIAGSGKSEEATQTSSLPEPPGFPKKR